MRSTFILVLLIFSFLASAQTFTRFDLDKGYYDSGPALFTVAGSNMFFTAADTNGRELWVTDGTDTGTHMVKDITPGNAPSDIRYMAALGDTLYFSTTDTSYLTSLWRSDGTDLGTYCIKRLGLRCLPNQSPAGLTGNLISYNHKLLFFERDSTDGRLWASDGTDTGSHIIYSFGNTLYDNNPVDMFRMLGKIYFLLSDNVHGRQVWCTDGTAAGTQMVYTPLLAQNHISTTSAVVVNNKLFFPAYDATHGTELWVSDGTVAGTKMVTELNPGPKNGILSDGIAYKGKYYFGGIPYGTSSRGLYCTDGTDTGTHLIDSSICRGISGIQNAVVLNDTLYFFSADRSANTNLYITDGTAANLAIIPDSTGNVVSSGCMATYNGHVYIETPMTSRNAPGLYQSNGSKSTTYIVLPGKKRQGFPTVSSSYFMEFKKAFWFGGQFDSSGWELWHLGDIDTSTSVEKIGRRYVSFSIYPNPNNGNFTINTNIHTGIVTVYDITGRIILSADVKGNITDLQLPAGVKGIYFIKLQSGDAVGTRKILVE